MENISLKVLAPTILLIVAGLLLWLITGDNHWVIASLAGIVTGGVGGLSPPAPGVKQSDVADLSRARKRHQPRPHRRR